MRIPKRFVRPTGCHPAAGDRARCCDPEISKGASLPYMLAVMDRSKTTLERAFQLAETGRYATFTDVSDQLAWEGYDRRQLQGPALRKQLIGIIRKARLDANGA